MSRIRRQSFALKHMIQPDDEDSYGSPDRMFSKKKLEPIKLEKNKSQRSSESNGGNGRNILMHGKVSETLGELRREKESSSSGGKASWWDVVRFWVTSGMFGEKVAAKSDAGMKLALHNQSIYVNNVDNTRDNDNNTAGRSQKRAGGDIDFDEEGRKILASKLGLVGSMPSGGDDRNDYDAVYRSPKGGGIIYVGNERTAKNKQILRKLGVTRIINCTHGSSQLPNYHQPSTEFIYLNFQICYWEEETKGEDDKLIKFFNNVFNFIDVAITGGKNVLIHCLAGAHRAGTTAVACLMHYADMEVNAAIAAAKTCRAIIDPISHLATLLNMYNRARMNRKLGKSINTIKDARQKAMSYMSMASLTSHGSASSSSSPDVLDMGFTSQSFAHESYVEKTSQRRKNSRHSRYTYDAHVSQIEGSHRNNITTLVPLEKGKLIKTGSGLGLPDMMPNESSKYGKLHDELSPGILNKRRQARNKRQSF